MSPLIMFYLGSHPDSSGRYLSEILVQDDIWLENTHNYVQWLFPNKIPSRAIADAPLLTTEISRMFRNDDILQRHLQASLRRMLHFYGLKLSNGSLVIAENWDERKRNWFTQDTHNNLRITRILLCLNECGVTGQAQQIYADLLALKIIFPDCGISKKTFQFWENACLNLCPTTSRHLL